MAVYTFTKFLVLDEAGNPARGATGSIYADSDTLFTTPLTVTDGEGLPLTVKTNEKGVGPAFKVDTDTPKVWWKSGTLPAEPLLSIDAAAAAGEDAATALSVAQGAEDSVVAIAPDNDVRAVGKGELVVNAKDHGAVGDGIADDTAAIQAALDAAAGDVLLPAGTYSTSSVTIPSGVTLRGAGRGVTVLSQSSSTDATVQAAGVLDGVTATLTVDAAPGALSITVDSTASLAAGDWLLLRDNSVPDSAYPTRFAGELVRVASVDSATVFTIVSSANSTTPPGVRGAFGADGWAAYTVANAADVRKITPVENVGVADLTVRNPAKGTGTAPGIDFKQAVGVSVSNVEVDSTDGPALNVLHAWGVNIDACWFHDLSDSDLDGRYGYGVNLGGAVHQAVVSDCIFERLRHGVTTNGNTVGGIPSNVIVADCLTNQTTSTAFDTHGAGAYIRFSDCVSVDSNGYAFVVRARYVTLVDCEAIRPRFEGLVVLSDTPRYTKAVGLIVREGLRAGIELRGLTNDTELVDCEVDGCGTSGIRIGYGSNSARIIRPRVYNVGQDAAAQGNGLEFANTGSGTPVTTGCAVIGGIFARTKSYEGDDDYRAAIAIPTTAVHGAVVADNHGWGLRSDVNFVNDSGTSTKLFSNGPWDQPFQQKDSTPAFASVDLLAATGRANAAKRAGDIVFDTTLGKPLWASGSATTAPWVDATGATVHTPA